MNGESEVNVVYKRAEQKTANVKFGGRSGRGQMLNQDCGREVEIAEIIRGEKLKMYQNAV